LLRAGSVCYTGRGRVSGVPGRGMVLDRRVDEPWGAHGDRRLAEHAWTSIRYPQVVWDEEGQCWISDA